MLTIIEYDNIHIGRIKDIEHRHTPYTRDEIVAMFDEFAKNIGAGEMTELVLNGAHESLNSEGGVTLLHDYIARYTSGEIVLNLGCCLFLLAEIKELDEQSGRAVVRFLLPEAYNAQPLVMNKYARRCFEKKEDALALVGG